MICMLKPMHPRMAACLARILPSEPGQVDMLLAINGCVTWRVEVQRNSKSVAGAAHTHPGKGRFPCHGSMKMQEL